MAALFPQVETEPGVSGAFPTPALRSLPKPVIPRKTTTPVPKKVDPENYVIFQDILFTGQEKCVEDWPDDSPQLNPDFKPDKAEVEGDGGDQELDGCDSTKEKFSDEAKEEKSSTLPASFRSSKKKHLKTRVSQLLRRASTTSSVPDGKRMNGLEKDGDAKTGLSKADSFRRWSEGTVLDESTEEEEGREAEHQQRRRKKLQVKFVPQRGFAISLEKTEAKGAHGYTPSQGSKVTGAHSTVSPLFRSQGDEFEDVEQLKAELHSTNRARGSPTNRRGSQESFAAVGATPSESSSMTPGGRLAGELEEPESHKAKKPVIKIPKKLKAKAEWMAAQMDEHAAAGLEDEEEDGVCLRGSSYQAVGASDLTVHDTDSLMEWWYTVEQWDELPSDEEDGADESKLEEMLLMSLQNPGLSPSWRKRCSAACGSSTRSSRSAPRSSGSTSSRSTPSPTTSASSTRRPRSPASPGAPPHAVGGVTAVAGLVLAPFTFGASLVMTAVGVGVATAGGITSASAAI
ncbi:unnamed protein product, partial [Tetraodon nigroviridis]